MKWFASHLVKKDGSLFKGILLALSPVIPSQNQGFLDLTFKKVRYTIFRK